LQSSYRPGGQSPPSNLDIVESTAPSGGRTVTWHRDATGATWWSLQNQSDAFTVSCTDPSASRMIAESTSLG
jgi:hypothetical protein